MRRPVAFGHRPLHRDRAGNGLNHARELEQHAVAGGFDDATLVLGDFRIDQFAAMHSEACEKTGLVLAHQPAISRENGGEPALEPLFAQGSLSEAPYASMDAGRWHRISLCSLGGNRSTVQEAGSAHRRWAAGASVGLPNDDSNHRLDGNIRMSAASRSDYPAGVDRNGS
jgi:hypothetical protein